jgi:hypothetical protein
VWVRQLPQESATWRSINPEGSVWTLEAHLVALAVDVLQMGNWQRAGKKGARRPKPIPRPGVKAAKSSKTFGGSGITLEAAQAKHEQMVAAARAAVEDVAGEEPADESGRS